MTTSIRVSLVLLLISSANADPFSLALETGAGVVSGQRAWEGQSAYFAVFPVLKAVYGPWEVNSIDQTLRYRFGEDSSDFSFNLGLGLRDEGYSASGVIASRPESGVYDGYQSPEGELVGVVGFDYLYFHLGLSQDLSGQSEGLSTQAAIYLPLYLRDDIATVYVGAGIGWQSAAYANALYGVAGSNVDATVGRHAYRLTATTSPFLSVDWLYSFNGSFQVNVSASAHQLDAQIVQSPLVGRENTTQISITLVYR
ncbi:MipA/OmpV family protein [Saccharospirillum alexandrii]|uniref:MipA/OmpV family protein n=1 Tax=Saccharospirillum alexandrii TaxID=2448477 RepID=UPI000FD8F681|nr:MipA/OmpV family protein [Saccharospirillum alexandrii]